MANVPTISEAVENVRPEYSDPIDFKVDNDDVLIAKINARISDAKPVKTKKCTEWKEADAYIDGDPSIVNPSKKKMIYNPLFPIARNMTGLVTDSKPNPSTRLVEIDNDMPDDQKEEMRKTANNLSISLEEWWDDLRGQSRLQQWVFGMWVYSDYYVFPYWNNKTKEVDVEAVKPTRVTIDPNADDIHNADYAVVDFYRSKQWMYSQYGKEKCAELTFADHNEIRLDDNTGESTGELLKNVCKLQLYMEAEWWVYKAGNKVMEKMRNPLWALDEASQKTDIESLIRAKHEKKGIGGMVAKGVDMVKGAVGMPTMEDEVKSQIEGAMMNFTPKKNYMKFPRIPLIQFDTYRMAGELYSKSTMKQSIEGVDNLNDRKRDIKENSENTGRPTTFIDGKIMNEDQAKRVEQGRARGETVRLNTAENKSLSSSVYIAQGVSLPAQFFESVQVDKREIDDIWGHHEVSRGTTSATNKTKGGILALQEADQTPIRYVTRNIEDALQDLFEWVVQIRKIFKPGKYALEAGGVIDYDIIDQHFKVFMKSGSMMPVSKEAQREEALTLWRDRALDPLTLFERLNDPEPEKTAKRLEMWTKEHTVMTDDMDDQQIRVLEKIKLVQANQFNQIQITPDDDPKIHSDMLKMALKSGQFSPEQEDFIAQLVQKYDQLAAQSGNQPSGEAPQGEV